VVIAGTHSGVGKTTVATGLMAALVARGHRVAAAKVGPDFIDPSYHRLATGHDSCTLDAFLSGEEMLASLAARASDGNDVLIIEGVMGMFDGSGQPGCDGATAAVSRLLDAPVVLVVDASAMSGSVAALVHGFVSFDPDVRVAGVIVNRVGSERHGDLLREALRPLNVAVLGSIRRDDRLTWRERHLGLVPVVEHPREVEASLASLAAVIEESIDLDEVLRVARSAPTRRADATPRARHVGSARIALCAGKAFSFVYPENLELLSQSGAELVAFDPLVDTHLPENCTALYAGGGFPEVYAEALAENRSLLGEVRARVRAGMPTWAECGGLLLLCESLDGVEMANALPGVHATMSERLSLGYRRATTRVGGLFGPAGTELRAHEFHRTITTPPGDALAIEGSATSTHTGFATPTLFASYLHQHLSATPELAERFVAAASQSPLRSL
jgi:cobyrinic acid a,c-diamide synthase